MKRFLTKLFVLLLIITVILTAQIVSGIYIIGPQYTQDYNAALIDKVARLKSISTPKIILVGNSNVSFGFISPMIEEILKMPVVNLGLHGGLGNAFHENIAKLNINSGDLIIVCHSDFNDNDSISDVQLAWTTLEYHKELWESMRPKDCRDIILGWPNYWFNALLRLVRGQGNKEPSEPTPYARKNFNEQGDIIARPDNEKKFVFASTSVKVPSINNICIDRLNELNKYVNLKGAVLAVAGYPIGAGKYMTKEMEKAFDDFQENLKEKLDCPVISDYKDYFMPYDLFYNTNLHLSQEGARVRTIQLINDIKKARSDKKI